MSDYTWVQEYESALGPWYSTDRVVDVFLDIRRFDPDYVESLHAEQDEAQSLRDVAAYLATRPAS